MAVLSKEHIAVLGPLIDPFGRSPHKTIENDLREGEGHNDEFLDFIHDGRDNKRPKQYVELTATELDILLKGNPLREKCFLWVIDHESIKILHENTRNTLRSSIGKPYVCHTNITGCCKAYIGGEMYFCENGNIYVNFKSDRYGRPETDDKKRMAIKYMSDAGYKNIICTDDLI
jgi:hypothetical protein